ncbi:MAG TPA: TRAP transporter small permease [Euryarchaeota archaeon]|nr:TRAP transporter small permease [Euryarchaeota archaeon]
MSKLKKILGRVRQVTGKLNVDKAISRANKIIRSITLVGAAVSAILLLSAFLLIVAYVINRKFIGQIWLFPEEYIGLTLVPIAYLSMAYSLRCGAQVNMSIILNKFSPWKRNIIDLLASLVALFVLGFMTERSISWFVYVWQNHIASTGPMRTPLWGFSLTMVLGMVMLDLEMMLHLFRTLVAVVRRSGKTDGYLPRGQ